MIGRLAPSSSSFQAGHLSSVFGPLLRTEVERVAPPPLRKRRSKMEDWEGEEEETEAEWLLPGPSRGILSRDSPSAVEGISCKVLGNLPPPAAESGQPGSCGLGVGQCVLQEKARELRRGWGGGTIRISALKKKRII